MTRLSYNCLLSPRDLLALESVSVGRWNAIEWAGADFLGKLLIRTAAIRIRGLADVTIGVTPIDIQPKLEVFRLSASVKTRGEDKDPRYQQIEFLAAGEAVSAFLGENHQMLVGARRHPVPEWVADVVDTIIVEDLLVLRHSTGQQAFITPDDSQPGALLVARRKEEIAYPNAEVVYLRPV